MCAALSGDDFVMDAQFYVGHLVVGIVFAVVFRNHKVLRAGEPHGLGWLWYVITPMIWPYISIALFIAKWSEVRGRLRRAASRRQERRWYDFLL